MRSLVSAVFMYVRFLHSLKQKIHAHTRSLTVHLNEAAKVCVSVCAYPMLTTPQESGFYDQRIYLHTLIASDSTLYMRERLKRFTKKIAGEKVANNLEVTSRP